MLRVSGQIPKLARRPELLSTSRFATEATKTGPRKGAPPKITTITVKGAPIPPSDGARGGGSGGVFGKLLAGLMLGGGGLVAYAWYDPEFRKKLEGNLPTTLQTALHKYIPPRQLPTKPQEVMSTPLVDIPPAVKRLQVPSTPDIPPALKSKPVPPMPAVEESKEDALIRKKEEALRAKEEAMKKERDRIVAESSRKEEAQKALVEAKKREADRLRSEKEAVEARLEEENKELEALLTELVAEANELSEVAIDAQKIAASVTKLHSQKLKAAMDLTEDLKGKEQEWVDVTIALESRQEAKECAEQQQFNAKRLIEKLQATIHQYRAQPSTQGNKCLRTSEEALNNIKYELNTAMAEVTKAESDARVMQEYSELVKKGREQFRKELESIWPDVRGPSNADKLTEEELNSLIAHAHRRVEQLRHQLLEATVLEQSRIQAALDRQIEEDRDSADQRVERETERLQAQFLVAKLSWDAEAEVEFEERLRKHLSRQAAAHSDHLTEVLKVQEKELEMAFEVYLAQKLEEEQDKFREKTAQWVGRMGGIELALTARSDKEVRARKAQELWLACTALQNVIANGKPAAFSYADQLKPLAEEVTAIQAAGNKHPFVAGIAAGMPEEALERGVWTEEGLKNRFRKVHRISRRVALVDETGGTLLKFALSYVQSMFVRNAAITEVETIPEDVAALSTFALVDTALHYLELGNLEMATRLMNQLRGESRAVAVDWIDDARLLLETRQAATVLLAHASAEGLGALV